MKKRWDLRLLLVAVGPPSECEIGRQFGEAGRDRKTMEREEQDVLFHLHM